MTACVKNHSKRVALAVSASLVGALSLGAAAPAAYAANEGISTLASTSDAIGDAKVTYTGGEANQTFMFDGLSHGLIPTKVEYGADLGGLVYPAPKNTAERNEGDFYYFYIDTQATSGVWAPKDVTYTDADGNKHKVEGSTVYTQPTEPGTYVTVVARWNGTGWEAFVADAAAFTIAAKDLTASTIYQGDDVTDTTFEYTGIQNSLQAQNFKKQIGVAINGVAVDTDELTMNIYDAKGNKLAGATELVPGNTYTVAYQWNDRTDHTERTFKLEKMDLSKTAVIGKAIDSGTAWYSTSSDPNVVKFNEVVEAMGGVQNDSGVFDWAFERDLSVDLLITKTPGDGTVNRGENGVYTVTMTAKTGDDYVTGSTSFEVYVGDKTADVKFDNMDLWQGDHYYVDLNDDDQAFDLSNIIAVIDGSGTIIKNKDLDIKVLNADATAADADALAKPGTHYVVVNYNKKINGVSVVASEMVKVVTSYTVDVAGRSDVYMSYDGENVEYSAEDVYSGEDFTEKMAFKVTAGDKTLVAGDDYTVTFKKVNDKGDLETVESITDAGLYYVFVDGVSYSGQTIFAFRVNPLAPAYAVPVWDLRTDKNSENKLPQGYLIETGSELAPTFKFYDADYNEIPIPEGSYEVDSYDSLKWDASKYKWVVDERDVVLDGAGTYQAHLSTAEGVVNYDLAMASVEIRVTDGKVFADVPADHWGAQGIFDAYALGYMSGYAGTTFFGPEDNLSRAQAAVVLFNMGTGGTVSETDDLYNKWFERGLAFPDAEQWYAAELGWASQVGVVSGYPNGNYGGADEITREQFAIMLRNYAAAKGEDVSVDDVDAALEGVKDADTISGWAREAVAWAVESGVMGAEGYVYADQPVQRAQVALMTTRYQPEKLTEGDLIIGEASRI